MSFKKIWREKTINLLNRFLFIVIKHLLINNVFELFFNNEFNFSDTPHLNRVKKLTFLNISLETK